MVPLLITGNPQSISTFTTVQSIGLMALLESKLPKNLQKYVISTNQGFRGMFPNILKIDESNYICFLDTKLQEAGYSCLTFNNVHYIFFIIIPLLIIKLLLKLLVIIVINRNEQFKRLKYVNMHNAPWYVRLIKTLNFHISSTLFTKVVFAVQIDALTGAMIGLQNLQFDSWKGITNIVLIIFIFGVYLTYFVLISWVVYHGGWKGKHDQYKFFKKWRFLTSFFISLKKDSKISKMFIALVFIKNFFFPIIIITFLFNAQLQLIPMELIIFINSLFVIFVWPHLYFFDVITTFLSEFLYGSVLMGILALEVVRGLDEKEKYVYVGFGLVLILTLILLMKTLISIFASIMIVKRLLNGQSIENPIHREIKDMKKLSLTLGTMYMVSKGLKEDKELEIPDEFEGEVDHYRGGIQMEGQAILDKKDGLEEKHEQIRRVMKRHSDHRLFKKLKKRQQSTEDLKKQGMNKQKKGKKIQHVSSLD